MKTITQKLIMSLMALAFFYLSCQKLDPVSVTKPCQIQVPTSIDYTSAIIKGRFADVGEGITSYGHCWSINPTPDINDFKTIISGNPPKRVDYTSELRALSPGTKYYVRAYFVNSTGIIYSNEINFNTDAVPSNQLVDCDNNLYDTVKIGTQIWMKSNLKVTRFKDGLAIPLIIDKTAWTNLNTPGYCWGNNNESNKNIYGALYNWFAVIDGKLCPTGWHVPTDQEWATLINFLGGLNVAGGKLKETGTLHWAAPNNGATNETGFTALPGGVRGNDGLFYVLGQYGNWWTSTQFTTTQARSIAIGYPDSRIFRDSIMWKNDGKSVRCLKD